MGAAQPSRGDARPSGRARARRGRDVEDAGRYLVVRRPVLYPVPGTNQPRSGTDVPRIGVANRHSGAPARQGQAPSRETRSSCQRRPSCRNVIATNDVARRPATGMYTSRDPRIWAVVKPRSAWKARPCSRTWRSVWSSQIEARRRASWRRAAARSSGVQTTKSLSVGLPSGFHARSVRVVSTGRASGGFTCQYACRTVSRRVRRTR